MNKVKVREMAVFRQIQIDFWQDELVAEFTPEDKLFYLYLMTNSKTNQCGIYRINKRIMAFDIGWNVDTVDKMLARFVSYGRIRYNEDESEIYIINWIKHNSARSPKVAARVDTELKDVKTTAFHDDVVKQCIEYRYPIHTVPILVCNKNNNNNQNNNKNNNNNQDNEEPQDSGGSGQNAHSFYQANFGIEPPFIMQDIEHWISDMSEELVLEALKKAVEAEKPYNYAKGILRNWLKKGIKTLADVEAEMVKRDRGGYQVAESTEKTEEEKQLDELSRQRLDAVVIDDSLDFF